MEQSYKFAHHEEDRQRPQLMLYQLIRSQLQTVGYWEILWQLVLVNFKVAISTY